MAIYHMRSMRFQALLTGLLLAMLAVSAGAQSTDAYRERISRDYAAQIEARYGVVDDPAANERVASIVKRLLEAVDTPDFSWRFRILADPTPNAFALPNGFIYVHQGLLDMPLESADRPAMDPALPPGGRARDLEATISDDELAYVLGHEMSHVIQSHAMRLMGARRGLANLGVGGIFDSLLSSGFSREFETDADRWALAYVLQAGYNPRASLRFFERLRRLEMRRGPSIRLFPSHPRTADRLKNLSRWIAELKIPEEAPGAFNGTPTEGLPLVWIPAAALPQSTGSAEPVLKEAPQVRVTATEGTRPERERIPEELGRRMTSLLQYANVSTAQTTAHADVTVRISVADFQRTRMPWPGGVNTRYEVAVCVTVLEGEAESEVLKATAAREGTGDSEALLATVLDDLAGQLQERVDAAVRKALSTTERQREPVAEPPPRP